MLNDVVAGRRSGIEAFLAGELTVRGNLALALQLDGLFPGDAATTPAPSPARSTAGGIETFYLEAGPVDAPPVVLVHGLGATNASMLPLICGTVARLPRPRARPARARRHPGQGRRSTRAQFLGNWLLAFLRETCTEPAVLVGNSLGGRTALEAALAVALRRARAGAAVPRGGVPQAAPVRAARAPGAQRDRGAAGADPASGRRARPAQPVRRPDPAARRPGTRPPIDEFIRVLSLRPNRLAIFSALRHVYLDEPFGESGFWERLPALKPPALFLWGDRDVLVPAGFSRFVAEALPAAQCVDARRLRARATVRTSGADCPLHHRFHCHVARANAGGGRHLLELSPQLRPATKASAALNGSVSPATTRRAAASSAAGPVTAPQPTAYLAERDRLDLGRCSRHPAPLELAVALHPVPVLGDRRDDLLDPLAARGDRLEDGRAPGAGLRVPAAERLHARAGRGRPGRRRRDRPC